MSAKPTPRQRLISGRELLAAMKRGLEHFERSGKRLAQLGWAIPMSLTATEVYSILEAKTPAGIDEKFVSLYESDGRRYFNKTLRDLLRRKSLRQWRRLLRQAVSAYRRGHFAITVPALLTVIEGVILQAHGNTTKPLRIVDERVANLEKRSPDSLTLILWRIVRHFVAELFQKSDFTGPRPTGLNRHWILHGRDVDDWDQADSLRLFQAVDTISSLSEPAKRRPSR